jgi:dynein heavy chain
MLISQISIQCTVFHCDAQVKQVLDEILEKLPDDFNVQEMMARCEDRNPYVVVAFQECERMSMLTSEMRRSLKELDLGLKVCCR